MNIKVLLAGAIAIVFSFSPGFGQITNNPKVEESSAAYVKIKRVELTDQFTIVHLLFTEKSSPQPLFFPSPRTPDQRIPKEFQGTSSIWLDPETRLYKPGEVDKKFKFIKADNIPTDSRKGVMPGDTVNFVAYFERLDPGIEVFDFYEGRSSGGNQSWNFYGIHIKNPLKKDAKAPQAAAKVDKPVKKPVQPAPKPKVEEKQEPAEEPVAAEKPKSGLEKMKTGKMAVGETISLPNVYFETSKVDLLPESYEELNTLVDLMKESENIKIRVEGHTDNVGDFDKNLDLSRKRAESVRSYLIEKGIAADRIEAKGYGGTRPLAKGTSEVERSKNRRVEFVVTQM
ncbi:OmpA family protein [Dyadobacter psychrophilus]|uniref:Outer membrane protein OmpA n=1 Tax=Dyadobacter psychrophilus TaxID=651661 RepID=A0A1T5H8F5_9BACT|nr:OmpA family protein [Dyadobacter psychrophilus]SKC16831.1 Outer membrane protein OmpA [Dyadobacter psychrophilus]